jgi:hypothetical protein
LIVMGAIGCSLMLAGSLAANAQSTEVLARAGAVALGRGPVEVALEAPEGPLDARVAALGADRKLFLVLRDIRTTEQPGVLYRIYLGLPRGAQPVPDGFHAVGALNLFNASPAPDPARFYSYEVTDLVKALRDRRSLSQPVTVTIAPTAPPDAQAHPVIGEISLVAQ